MMNETKKAIGDNTKNKNNEPSKINANTHPDEPPDALRVKLSGENIFRIRKSDAMSKPITVTRILVIAELT